MLTSSRMVAGRRAILLSLLLIPLLAFLAHARVLTVAGKTWMTRADNPSTWYPRLQFVARWVAQDVIPLWDPFTNAGRPVAGDLQSGLWYLPNWILFATADPIRGISFDAFDYFFLAHLIGVQPGTVSGRQLPRASHPLEQRSGSRVSPVRNRIAGPA